MGCALRAEPLERPIQNVLYICLISYYYEKQLLLCIRVFLLCFMSLCLGANNKAFDSSTFWYKVIFCFFFVK